MLSLKVLWYGTATHNTIARRQPSPNRNNKMGFLHLFIVNKSGGLILHRPLGPSAPSIGTNEWLRIGSTFHSLHAIAAEAGPVRLPGNKNSCECIIISMVVEIYSVNIVTCIYRFETHGNNVHGMLHFQCHRWCRRWH